MDLHATGLSYLCSGFWYLVYGLREPMVPIQPNYFTLYIIMLCKLKLVVFVEEQYSEQIVSLRLTLFFSYLAHLLSEISTVMVIFFFSDCQLVKFDRNYFSQVTSDKKKTANCDCIFNLVHFNFFKLFLRYIYIYKVKKSKP